MTLLLCNSLTKISTNLSVQMVSFLMDFREQWFKQKRYNSQYRHWMCALYQPELVHVRRSFINFFSKLTSCFHRQAKLFELTFLYKKNSSATRRWSNPAGKTIFVASQFPQCLALNETLVCECMHAHLFIYNTIPFNCHLQSCGWMARYWPKSFIACL